MHRFLLTLALSLPMVAANASSTLRVGNQVLTAGDSALRVTELLGKPSHKSHASGSRSSTRRGRHVHLRSGTSGGERWSYRRGDHVTTVTLVDDRVVDIDDRRD